MKEKLDKLTRYRRRLRIDRDDLDTALLRHSEYYDKVSEAQVEALAKRDMLKLDLEIATAAEDRKLRHMAAVHDEKITEPKIRQEIAGSKKLQELERDYLNAKHEEARWSALKDSWQQRSYALRELVQIHLRRMSQRDSMSSTITGYAVDMRERAGRERQGKRK